MPVTLIAVYDAQYDRTLLVPESEARAGLLRYAATLPAGSPDRAAFEDKALNGDLPAWPPVEQVA